MLVHEAMPPRQTEPELAEPTADIEDIPLPASPAEAAFTLGADIQAALQVVFKHIPLSAEEAIAVAPVLEAWAEGREYAPGQMVRMEAEKQKTVAVYSVLAAHTSAPAKSPDKAPALYKLVAADTKTET